jgi:hypothetical protein
LWHPANHGSGHMSIATGQILTVAGVSNRSMF